MKKSLHGATIRAYGKDRWKMLLLLLLFVFVFTVMTALYSLPLAAVIYSAMLCIALLFVAALLDYARYYKIHQQLTMLLSSPLLDAYSLPLPSTQMQKDYTLLLEQTLRKEAEFTAQAENMHRMQVEYYSLWTHQIKVPISAMHLLLQSSPGMKGGQLNAELFKIEQYVDMALSYVRLEGTETDYVIKTYPLDHIIRQAVRKFAPLFIQKKLAVDYQETSVHVLTDEKWLVFALEQVLSNAVKYSRRGCITIWVEAQSKTLYIKDQGIGITPRDIPRIFEHGYTGYNGREDKRATGLGLYLCKKILTKLGHTIVISSVLDEGTLVEIDLSQIDLQLE